MDMARHLRSSGFFAAMSSARDDAKLDRARAR